MKPGLLFRLIFRNKVTWSSTTIFRILFLLQSSLWSALFSFVEKIRYGKVLKNHPLPVDPVFIIGHWRTGSTFLHQLMSRDPNLAAPTLFQVAIPDGFMVSHAYYTPIFNSMVEAHRPMDNVKLGMDEPQEDEYALYRLTDQSPLERIVFPINHDYFLKDFDAFIPPPEKISRWSLAITKFYKKLSFKTGRRIVSKNPFNSMRIPLLIKLFPDARFILIGRDPLDVVPSTINMWNIILKQNALNHNFKTPSVKDVTLFMEKMHLQSIQDLQQLKKDRFTMVIFENLERKPVETLQEVYARLNLPFTPDFQKNLENFLTENSGFTKNSFSLTAAERQQIVENSEAYRSFFKYNDV